MNREGFYGSVFGQAVLPLSSFLRLCLLGRYPAVYLSSLFVGQYSGPWSKFAEISLFYLLGD